MLRAPGQVPLGIDLAKHELRAALLEAPARARIGADAHLAVQDEMLFGVLGRLGVVEDVDVCAAALHAAVMPGHHAR